ncbi:MAG TPA: DUF885 domain-containing protein [Acidimicrobiales bacterium]|nr:DUF885 domain-containing protein [Acidimicrobiales bacterium]
MATPRALADRFHAAWLATHPLAASGLGVPGYDDRVPDASEAGADAWRSQVDDLAAAAEAVDAAALTEPDAVTMGVLTEHLGQERAALDEAAEEYTVSAMPFSGPAALLAVLARTVLVDQAAADDFVTRLRRSGTYLDQLTDRLRTGAGNGLLPVTPLVEQAIAWGERVLADGVPAAVTAPEPPADVTATSSWSERRDAAAVEELVPALARWVDQLRELLPRSRPGDQAGLCHLPDGGERYGRAIRVHTTLALTAEELHRTGLEQTELLSARAVELGATIGLHGLDEVLDAIRGSAGRVDPATALDAARAAVARAEEVAGTVFPAPLPGPCAVTPMPSVVAQSGMAPHYTTPRPDGTRPGTYWFNTELPTAGTGFDLESVAFHETVPGHHLQLSRVQLLDHLPDLQRLRHLTVFVEGWGLYAEQLAEEMGLYSGTEALLGTVTASLMRSARLVLDTGVHALGWSRDDALAWYVAHVPLPAAFLANELDRYISWPGQALAYMTGRLQLLEVRDAARRRLGPAFSLPAFHARVLDSGSLPMPVLRAVVESWDGSGPA